MSKNKLIREIRDCKRRNLPTDGLLKPALQTHLGEELQGVQRVPVLWVPNQRASMKHLNLAKYSVVPVQHRHDLEEHVSNILKTTAQALH